MGQFPLNITNTWTTRCIQINRNMDLAVSNISTFIAKSSQGDSCALSKETVRSYEAFLGYLPWQFCALPHTGFHNHCLSILYHVALISEEAYGTSLPQFLGPSETCFWGDWSTSLLFIDSSNRPSPPHSHPTVCAGGLAFGWCPRKLLCSALNGSRSGFLSSIHLISIAALTDALMLPRKSPLLCLTCFCLHSSKFTLHHLKGRKQQRWESS